MTLTPSGRVWLSVPAVTTFSVDSRRARCSETLAFSARRLAAALSMLAAAELDFERAPASVAEFDDRVDLQAGLVATVRRGGVIADRAVTWIQCRA
jgi:hypothetical protein